MVKICDSICIYQSIFQYYFCSFNRDYNSDTDAGLIIHGTIFSYFHVGITISRLREVHLNDGLYYSYFDYFHQLIFKM